MSASKMKRQYSSARLQANNTCSIKKGPPATNQHIWTSYPGKAGQGRAMQGYAGQSKNGRVQTPHLRYLSQANQQVFFRNLLFRAYHLLFLASLILSYLIIQIILI
ncbi:hypothetical protein PM082_019165 [Marasmius tenuissimus]|nr:hypothetical protein PM082_019165 [Marasmius tenuissimus]